MNQIDVEQIPTTKNKLTEEQWRTLCAEWAKSKLPQKQFCNAHNVNYPKFVSWRSKILKEKGLSRSKQFSAVKIKQPCAIRAVPAAVPVIKLQFPTGIVISLSANMETKQLSKIFTLLGLNVCSG